MTQTPLRNSRVLLLGICLLALPAISLAQEPSPPHWSYKGSNDPRHWSQLDPAFAECSNGHQQAPINITGAKPADLPALKFDYNPVPLTIVDNGHTIMVTYAPGSVLTVGENVYKLTQFHFHHPSEEHINGAKFDMVAHLVHADAAGHLAVVAVLFRKGDANPLLETLWKNIPAEKEKSASPAGVTVNVKDLLPADLGYYTFTGSLTTPPCTEGVTWYVLKSPSTLSPQQLAAFAKLYPSDNRPIQPTNQRAILQTR
jgi:carbonic anhydrase